MTGDRFHLLVREIRNNTFTPSQMQQLFGEIAGRVMEPARREPVWAEGDTTTWGTPLRPGQ